MARTIPTPTMSDGAWPVPDGDDHRDEHAERRDRRDHAHGPDRQSAIEEQQSGDAGDPGGDGPRQISRRVVVGAGGQHGDRGEQQADRLRAEDDDMGRQPSAGGPAAEVPAAPQQAGAAAQAGWPPAATLSTTRLRCWSWRRFVRRERPRATVGVDRVGVPDLAHWRSSPAPVHVNAYLRARAKTTRRPRKGITDEDRHPPGLRHHRGHLRLREHFTTRSTAKSGVIHVEVCSNCHPFYTGKQKILDTGGRVAKFEARYGKRSR